MKGGKPTAAAAVGAATQQGGRMSADSFRLFWVSSASGKHVWAVTLNCKEHETYSFSWKQSAAQENQLFWVLSVMSFVSYWETHVGGNTKLEDLGLIKFCQTEAQNCKKFCLIFKILVSGFI